MSEDDEALVIVCLGPPWCQVAVADDEVFHPCVHCVRLDANNMTGEECHQAVAAAKRRLTT